MIVSTEPTKLINARFDIIIHIALLFNGLRIYKAFCFSVAKGFLLYIRLNSNGLFRGVIVYRFC